MVILKHYGKGSAFSSILLAWGLMIMLGCTKADVPFGGQLLEDGYGKIVKMDTISPSVSTIFLDSFQTSATGTAVLGSYEDSLFGKISASAYFQLKPPTYSANNVDSFSRAIYDSTTVLLTLESGNYYGDTAKPLSLSVYELNDNIDFKLNESVLYNTSGFATKPTSLGSKSFTLLPNAGSFYDTVPIKLSDAFGEDLWDKITTGDNNIQTDDGFIAYMKGLKISPSSFSNSFVFGVKDSITLRIHYRMLTADGVENRIASFTLYDNTKQFNHIDIDRSNTALGNAGINSDNDDIPSYNLDNKAYLQYITGTAIKISFPNAVNIMQAPGFVQLSSASLIVRPLKGTYSDLYPLPSQLRLTPVNFDNTATASDLTSSSSTQYGSLYTDIVDGTETNYTYDLTSYLSSNMGAEYKQGYGLVLSPPLSSARTKFNRTVIGDYNGPQYGNMQLIIYYLAIQ